MLPVERAVQVVVALPVARSGEDPRPVDGLGVDDGRDRVEEEERRAADRRLKGGGHRVRSERAGGDEDRAISGERGQFVAHDPDPRVARQGGLHAGGKRFAIHGERASRRHPHFLRQADEQAAELAELGLEESVRGGEGVRLEGVRAHELGESGRVMRRRHFRGAHLEEHHVGAALRRLPRRLGPGQPPAGNPHFVHVAGIVPPAAARRPRVVSPGRRAAAARPRFESARNAAILRARGALR